MTLLQSKRRAAGVSVEQIAYHTGIPAGTYVTYEQGRHKLPLTRALILSEYLGECLREDSSKLLSELARDAANKAHEPELTAA